MIRLPDLARRLAEWSLPAACVADTNSLSAAYPLATTFTKAGIQPIHGLQIAVSHPGLEPGKTDVSELVLAAQDEAGYEQLCRFLSRSLTEEAPLPLKVLLNPDHSSNFLVLTGGRRGPVDKAFAAGDDGRAEQRLGALARAFGDRLYCEIQRQDGAPDYSSRLLALAESLSVPCLATSEAWFMERDMAEIQDVLLCISDGMTLNHDNRRKADPDGHLKSPDEMAALFADCPAALENSLEAAMRCRFAIAKKKPVLPAFPTRGGRSETEELRVQAREGLERRLSALGYDRDVDEIDGRRREDYHKRLDYELGVIEGMGFPGYFLIVADFIAWAKAHDIPVGPGRGSGAGSLVAYALTITDLDPLRYGLFFERFLNPERVSMPDFDIDFCQKRRECVIDYVRTTYGEENVAQIGTLGTLKAKAAVRDTGRVLQIPFPVVDRYAKLIPENPAHPVKLSEAMSMEPLASELAGAEENILAMFRIATGLEGLYRHQSTHAAGVVIGNRPIHEVVPVYRDLHGARVTCFDMKSVENAGLVKFDFLGLKTLDVIQDTCDIVERAGGQVDLDTQNTEDPDTYRMLREGDSFAVFQLESAGMRKAMVQIQPTCIEDIVALVSLYRPGPMENIPTYARVKAGDEEPHYLHPGMEQTLKETYGIIVYQEQVMKLARDLSGYTLGGADMLRRAMGKKIASEMAAQRDVFQSGAEKNGIDPAIASEIFDLIARFADYGFNKSHAAAYAVIAYQTAYLRCHHPAAFLSASMNLDINDVEKLAEALENARRSHIVSLPPDINASQAMFDVEPADNRLAIRHGLAALRGLGTSMAADIVAERVAHGPFVSLHDIVRRTRAKINRKALEALVQAGALDGLHRNRKAMAEAIPGLLTDAGQRAEEERRGQMTMFDVIEAPQDRDRLPDIADWPENERLLRQFRTVGMFLDGHPLEAARPVLNRRRGSCQIRDILDRPEELPQMISLAGVITESLFKRTAKKKPMLILKLSDETGLIEAIAFDDAAEHVRSCLGKLDGTAARFDISLSAGNGDTSLFIRDAERLALDLFG